MKRFDVQEMIGYLLGIRSTEINIFKLRRQKEMVGRLIRINFRKKRLRLKNVK